jgi:hypothetical protein
MMSRLHVHTRPGSSDLVNLYLRQRRAGHWLVAAWMRRMRFAGRQDGFLRRSAVVNLTLVFQPPA